jgi:hypothetical protein
MRTTKSKSKAIDLERGNEFRGIHRKSPLPTQYGFICSNCDRRWGEKQRGGYVDIRRCKTCPPLKMAAIN